MFFREYVGDYLEPLPADLNLKPFCPEVPTSLLSMDHLVGVRMRDQLQVAPEGGLKEAFQGILHTVMSRAETCILLFRKSEILHFKVSITNTLQIFFGKKTFLFLRIES